MFNGDLHYQSQTRQEEMQRRGEEHRRIREALRSGQAEVRFYKPLLAKFGRRMIAWGVLLRDRYEPLTAARPDPCVETVTQF